MRRIVTGHNHEGRSVFVSDGEPPRQPSNKSGGFRIDTVWVTEGIPRVPVPLTDPTLSGHQYFPAVGSTRFVIVHFHPESVRQEALRLGVDPAKATEEFFQRVPGLGHLMEEEMPGMHTSDTIDYGVVLFGKIELELDDGAKTVLYAGDCVIQNGTRHRWRNPGPDVCIVAFTVVGAERQQKR